MFISTWDGEIYRAADNFFKNALPHHWLDRWNRDNMSHEIHRGQERGFWLSPIESVIPYSSPIGSKSSRPLLYSNNTQRMIIIQMKGWTKNGWRDPLDTGRDSIFSISLSLFLSLGTRRCWALTQRGKKKKQRFRPLVHARRRDASMRLSSLGDGSGGVRRRVNIPPSSFRLLPHAEPIGKVFLL